MCKSKEMAEDVVQDSFMKLWEEVGHIAYDKAKSFLFSTAYHRMIDVLRRKRSLETSRPWQTGPGGTGGIHGYKKY
ncbi:MAG: RNA polymerase sigma factor [Butyricimonas paravirosa]